MTPTIDHDHCLPGVALPRRQKRGVLLLVVLSLLTLFMLLGTTYMVVTSRARATARAFARAVESSHSAQSAAGRRFVDEAFLGVARGPSNHEDANANGVLDNGEDHNSNNLLDPIGFPAGEDLLGDKFGFATRSTTQSNRLVLTGKLAAPSALSGVADQASQPMLVFVPVKAPLSVGPEQLTGRVITFTLPDFTWSTRILRAQGTGGQTTTGFVISLAPVAGCRGATLSDLSAAVTQASTTTLADFIVNTREFVGDPSAPPSPGVAKDTNEPYDGFDNANPFLAQIVQSPAYSPTSSSSAIGTVTCARASYQTASPSATNQPPVDNDGDGVFDSFWLDFGFPVIRDSNGIACKPRVAVLVVDLDGRLNVNAHGSHSASATLQNGSNFTWPSTAPQLPASLSAAQFSALPVGSGYGPPEVRLGDVFRLGSNSAAAGTAFDRLLSGTKQAIDPNNPQQPYTGAKRLLVAATNAWGRYGDAGTDPRPGVSGVDDALSAIQDQQRARTTADNAVRGRSLCNDWRMSTTLPNWQADPDDFTSPPDLSGRMKVFADRQAAGDGVVARMRYAKPVVSGSHWWQDDTTDDAYEVRLDCHVAADSTFGPDELERVLRIYDWDATQLPSRLAAVLGPDAERLRLLLTTESWDTAAIVGTARKKVEDALGKTTATAWAEVFAPELIGGRRLDVNRPVHSAAEKQMLCRQLYTLLWALTGSSDTKSMAQWAVNVVDFRDADSSMTRFAYDKNPEDGWTPGTDVVWGVERPDLLINEAIAWQSGGGIDGGVYVTLHHPWSSKALDGNQFAPAKTNTDAPDWADPDAVDPALDAATPENLLNLDVRGGGDKDSPVWRLRVGDKIVRLDAAPNSQAGTREYWGKSANNNPTANRLVPPDGTVCVFGESKRPTDGTVDVDTAFPATAQIKIDMRGSSPVNLSPGNAETVTIILERLADPTQKYASGTNEYLEVDRVDALPVVDRTPDSLTNIPVEPYVKKDRKIDASIAGTFWKRDFEVMPALPGDPTDPISIDKPKAATRVACMPWLNRPFISAAELALVPIWDCANLLDQYSGLTANGMLDKLQATLNQQPEFLANLFETMTVPSRFAGIATTVDEYPAGQNPFQVSTSKADCDPGLDKLPIDQLSAYREPGRVNLNTVSDQRVWEATVLRGPRPDGTSTVANAALEWSTSNLGRPGDPSQSSTAKPVMSTLQMLALKGDATSPTMVADTADPGPDPAANPQFQYLTASRLANVATTRSHVFAVWVTVGFFQWDEVSRKYITDANSNPLEVGADTGTSQRHRGFYIFDRSIPVGYETGKDNNVRDAILLRRIIQ